MFRTGPTREMPVYDPRFGNDTLRYALIEGRVVVDGDLDLGTEIELLRRSWELAIKTAAPFDARNPGAAARLGDLRLNDVEKAKLQQLASRTLADFAPDNHERCEDLVRFATEALRPLQERRRPEDPRNVREHASVVFSVVSGQLRWPGGEIPYTIDPDVPIVESIREAMAHWSDRTGGRIRFRACDPKLTEDHVRFVQSPGRCESQSVGKRPGGGEQLVRLDPACGLPQVIHVIGHVVGLLHEHNRLDRQAYIRVDERHMDEGAADQFSQTLFRGSDVGAFDWKSIMLYPPKAFSKDGAQTLIKVGDEKDTAWGIRTGPDKGVTEWLSDGDVAAILKVYAGEPHGTRIRTPRP
jgi:hypothetical protein